MLNTNEIFAERYRLIRLIGRGGFAEVWLAQDTKTDIEVALKIYAPGKGMDEEGVKTFMKEFTIVFDLNHPNLLRPSHFDEWERMPYLIMPYCSKGSTTKLISSISEKELWKLLKDVADGLSYLHSKEPPVVHQDIKPDNILYNDEGQYMITDFGISTKIRSTLRKSVEGGKSSAGTLSYMAPERFGRDNRPIKSNDIWSVGAMLFELMTGDAPFGDHGGLLLMNGALVPNIEGDYSDDLKRVVELCLSKDSWDRPTAEQLVDYAQQWLQTGRVYIPQQSAKSTHEAENIGQTTQRQVEVAQPTVESDVPIVDNKPKSKSKLGAVIAAVVIIAAVAVSIFFYHTHQIEVARLAQIEADSIASLKATIAKQKADSIARVEADRLRADSIARAEETAKRERIAREEGAKAERERERERVAREQAEAEKQRQAEQQRQRETITTAKVFTKSDYERMGSPDHLIIPDGYTEIEEKAFYNCENLTSITMPNSIRTIGRTAFGFTKRLRSIDIPKSMTTIGYRAFEYSSIEKIIIPDNITSIGEGAFYWCDDLYSVTIPNSVTSIGEDAFCNADLSTITIPSSVTHIGDGIFQFCDNIQIINHSKNYVVKDGALYSAGLKRLIYVPRQATSFSIPSSVTHIGGHAFYSCNNLTHINIPNSVIYIGKSAFSSCEKLTSITISNSVEVIEGQAFARLHKVKAISIPISVIKIGYSAFGDYENLTNVKIPSVFKDKVDNIFGKRTSNIKFEYF